MRRFDVLDRAGQLKLPMLILHGFYDVQFSTAASAPMAVRVPDSFIKVLNTGHEAPAEDPEGVTRAVDSFLRTNIFGE
jgi:pimeloyl-ACP methyl ester carboxylesterase